MQTLTAVRCIILPYRLMTHAGNAWHREKPHRNIACMERKRYAFHEELGFQTLWKEEFPVWESLEASYKDP
jgi:hypothetical protein